MAAPRLKASSSMNDIVVSTRSFQAADIISHLRKPTSHQGYLFQRSQGPIRTTPNVAAASGSRFRHGTRFLRWRPDKVPRECTIEQISAAQLKATYVSRI